MLSQWVSKGMFWVSKHYSICKKRWMTRLEETEKLERKSVAGCYFIHAKIAYVYA